LHYFCLFWLALVVVLNDNNIIRNHSCLYLDSYIYGY